MGRLTLNILLSFAQFERELCSERVRDKFAAAKRKGKYIGGTPILGYTVDRERKKLVVDPKEAKLVRRIFQRFCELGSGRDLARELNVAGHRTKSWTTKAGRYMGGKPWDRGRIYKVLHNRTYIGQVTHLGVHVYPGEHEAIVEQALWDRAHAVLSKDWKARANRTRSNSPALLMGIMRCTACDCAMGPTHTTKAGRMYRYYVCAKAQKQGYDKCPLRTVPAGPAESAVIEQIRGVLRSPEIIAQTYREARTLEAEELERLRAEQEQLEERLKALRDKGQKLLGLGEAGSIVADELRRLGHETRVWKLWAHIGPSSAANAHG